MALFQEGRWWLVISWVGGYGREVRFMFAFSTEAFWVALPAYLRKEKLGHPTIRPGEVSFTGVRVLSLFRMRKPVRLGELLQGFWHTWDCRYAQAYITAHWAQWMGEPIAQRTEGIYAEGRVLKIFLNDPLLCQELHYRQSEILTFLHKQMGRKVFDKIIFHA